METMEVEGDVDKVVVDVDVVGGSVTNSEKKVYSLHIHIHVICRFS